jgi:uncharacterized glyoxalase superfamily protein PhnB
MSLEDLMGTVATLRPFVPAKDFGESRRFYEVLGFRVTPLGDKIARVELSNAAGAKSFLLQDFYLKDLAENLMLQLLVQDLDGWWRHIVSLNLDRQFGVGAPRPPQEQSWGQRVAYLWDPAGVLWHVAAANAKPASE